MSSTLNRWLIALSDPQGEIPLPGGMPFGECWRETLTEGILSREPILRRGLEDTWIGALITLLGLSDYHGTTPAVRKNLPRLGDLPGCDTAALDAIHDGLGERLLTQTAATMVLGGYARDIKARLAEANLPGVILKGPSLANAVYPIPALRTYTDIDVLVPREAIAPIRELLEGMGLAPQQDYKADLKHDHDHYGEEVYSAIAPSGIGVCIELHWNLVNSPSVQKGISVVYNDLVVDGRIPLESQLLIATVHGATSHQFDRLKFLVDTLQVLRMGTDQFDLDALGDLIGRTRTAGVVAMGCWLVDSLFGVRLGRELLATLHLRRPAWLDRRLLSPSVLLANQPSPLAKSRKNLYRQRLKRRRKRL